MAGSLPSKGRISLPVRRLSVRKIKEVLRLKCEVGLGLRAIARSCSIGLGTAHEYLQRAEAAKIAWPLGPEWDDDRLEAALFGGPPRSRPTVLPMPDFADLHRQRQQHSHVTQQLLWEEYRQANPDGYQYSRFCELYQRWRRKQDVVLRQEHKAGEKLFVDWAGTTIPIHDPRGGPVRQAHLFVAVLGASSYNLRRGHCRRAVGKLDRRPRTGLRVLSGCSEARGAGQHQDWHCQSLPLRSRLESDLSGDGHALRRRSGSGAAIQASRQGQSRIGCAVGRALDHCGATESEV